MEFLNRNDNLDLGHGNDQIGAMDPNAANPILRHTSSQVRPVSFPMGGGPNMANLAPTDFSALTTSANYHDHAGLGPINAGRNPVVRAKLQLNGHDRFQERLGSYFNLVQPYQHHTNIPVTGINVYKNPYCHSNMMKKMKKKKNIIYYILKVIFLLKYQHKVLMKYIINGANLKKIT